jgi:hypothetical protein
VQEKTLPRDLTTGTLIEAWARQPQEYGAFNTFQALKGRQQTAEKNAAVAPYRDWHKNWYSYSVTSPYLGAYRQENYQ